MTRYGSSRSRPLICRGFERGVGFGGVGQRIRCGDAHLDAALANPGHELLEIARIFGEPGQGIGAGENRASLFPAGA